MFQVMLWLRNHPGRPVTEADVAEIFAKAYSVAANYGNTASAFAKTGINPFNPDIFTDADYVPADVTDMPEVSTVSGAAESSSTMPPTDPDFSSLLPMPKHQARVSQRKRKVAHAMIATSSPFKQQLKEVQDKKNVKMLNMQERKRKREEKQKITEKGRRECKTKVRKVQAKGDSNKANSSDVKKSTRRNCDKSKKKPNKNTTHEKDSANCGSCGDVYGDMHGKKPDEDWLQCARCYSWFHESCAEECGLVDVEEFLCGTCV